ncbi:hypothetical protein MM213_07605 [Belliella sp. R4-6]|uniref:Uncharacterized protein n=1 Tax=Belliella alkalica TaxID=1730871 RepID=A0ABS9VA87_9BACT|nr:hypothetical protein [Belliella alkalica]MCH7413343.1 hypothetical protein [Belliella alkalica]
MDIEHKQAINLGIKATGKEAYNHKIKPCQNWNLGGCPKSKTNFPKLK